MQPQYDDLNAPNINHEKLGFMRHTVRIDAENTETHIP
ncbi:hypothetical protein HMPREF9162_0429 [Selenomonas sp. oral taxon 137 str. F0430]|nr:hypothetical protein HMPREF9162_0429 [Selenomonas sp. oral taxon 137 str. F0430]